MDEQDFDWSSWMTDQAEEAEKIKTFTAYGKSGGRPKKDENRYINLTIRLSETERTGIKGHADKFGLSMSEFLRQVGMGISPKEVSQEERELLHLLRTYHTHFARISSFMKKEPYCNSVELIEEITQVKDQIKDFLNDRYRKNN